MGRRGATTAKRERMELLRDADRPDSWMLLVDGIPQSHVDLADPTYLDFEYVRRLGHVVDLVAPDAPRSTPTDLGAGRSPWPATWRRPGPGPGSGPWTSTRTWWRWSASSSPGTVGRICGSLPGNPGPGWRRAAQPVPTSSSATFSWGRARLPISLSVEFAAEAARVVRLSGMYAVNVSDGRGLRYTRSQVATVAQVFQHVRWSRSRECCAGGGSGTWCWWLGTRHCPWTSWPGGPTGIRRWRGSWPGTSSAGGTAGAAVVHDAEAQDSPAPPESLFNPSRGVRREVPGRSPRRTPGSA